jgi:DNA polymerase epsilon subunit 1
VRVEACDFMEHCACSGEWVGEMKRAEVKDRLEVLSGVAGAYAFGMLGRVVADMLAGI